MYNYVVLIFQNYVYKRNNRNKIRNYTYFSNLDKNDGCLLTLRHYQPEMGLIYCIILKGNLLEMLCQTFFFYFLKEFCNVIYIEFLHDVEPMGLNGSNALA